MSKIHLKKHNQSYEVAISVGQNENREAIADRIEALAIELRSLSDATMRAVPSQGTLHALATKLYSARRLVDQIFDMQGFSVSPCWDIMLDLYDARAHGRVVSVTSASIGADCPQTTALRWLNVLDTMRLIHREMDPDDRRRTVVGLTEGAVAKIEKALEIHL